MRSRLVAVLAVLALVPFAGCLEKLDLGATAAKKPTAKDQVEVPAVVEPANITVTAQPTQKWPNFISDGASELITLDVPSFDAHKIPVTIYRPLVANTTQQVPVILHSHGFTGKRATTEDAFKEFVAAGFGVVSFDERGHGDGKDDSEVYFMHPDYEVQDVKKVIDHIATLDWVLMEAPGDPLLGAIGGSYGGAFQIMGAIFDSRFDAIVPEITWNDITEALDPNGAIKSGWVDLFYAAGNAQQSVVFSEDFHKGWFYANAANEFPRGQLYGQVPDLYTRLKESSPVSYPGRLTIPTLFIQGMPDTLFPLNQAVANLRMLESAGFGDDAALYTHNGGHVLSVNSLRPGTTPVPVGLQGQPGGKPCGELLDLQIAWLSKYLLELPVDTGPRVCLSLEDGSNVVGPTFPLPGTSMKAFDLGGPVPVAQAPAGPELSINVVKPAVDTIIAGIPTLRGNITITGAEAIVYFSLQVPARGDPFEKIVDDQVIPIRVAGPSTGKAFSIDMGGIGLRLKAGEQLVLVVSTVSPMYFGNAERVPGGAVIDDLILELPVVPTDSPTLVLPAST